MDGDGAVKHRNAVERLRERDVTHSRRIDSRSRARPSARPGPRPRVRGDRRPGPAGSARRSGAPSGLADQPGASRTRSAPVCGSSREPRRRAETARRSSARARAEPSAGGRCSRMSKSGRSARGPTGAAGGRSGARRDPTTALAARMRARRVRNTMTRSFCRCSETPEGPDGKRRRLRRSRQMARSRSVNELRRILQECADAVVVADCRRATTGRGSRSGIHRTRITVDGTRITRILQGRGSPLQSRGRPSRHSSRAP